MYLSLDNNEKSNSTTAKPAVEGKCVICFEQYKVGDRIVWSENDNNSEKQQQCRHVYHKDCMVRYLARNALQRRKRWLQQSLRNNNDDSNDDDVATAIDNPCPTCRRNYCTFTDDEILEMMVD